MTGIAATRRGPIGRPPLVPDSPPANRAAEARLPAPRATLSVAADGWDELSPLVTVLDRFRRDVLRVPYFA